MRCALGSFSQEPKRRLNLYLSIHVPRTKPPQPKSRWRRNSAKPKFRIVCLVCSYKELRPLQSDECSHAEGEFFDSRSHFNREQVKQRIHTALHTITPSPRMYCIGTGSNTFIVNHLILKYRNLRKLKKVITVGTATPSGTLTVKQIFDVGQVLEVRLCPEASASILPSDIINDCAVEVHIYKINGRRMCTLVANGKFIGGDEREFIFDATRHNGM